MVLHLHTTIYLDDEHFPIENVDGVIKAMEEEYNKAISTMSLPGCTDKLECYSQLDARTDEMRAKEVGE